MLSNNIPLWFKGLQSHSLFFRTTGTPSYSDAVIFYTGNILGH